MRQAYDKGAILRRVADEWLTSVYRLLGRLPTPQHILSSHHNLLMTSPQVSHEVPRRLKTIFHYAATPKARQDVSQPP